MDLFQYMGFVAEKRVNLNILIRNDITSYHMNYTVMRGDDRT